jgi:hypothetical protein
MTFLTIREEFPQAHVRADTRQTPLRARDNCIGVGALSGRDRGPAFRPSGSLAGMLPSVFGWAISGRWAFTCARSV